MRSNDEQVSWSTSTNKAAATQIPSKVFFPAAFRFTVSLQQKRAKRQSSCSSFFPLVGQPTSPQSFTHKNKNNSKKHTHTHTQTHKYTNKYTKLQRIFVEEKINTNFIALQKRTKNQSIPTAVRLLAHLRKRKTSETARIPSAKRKRGKKTERERERHTHTPNREINMQLPVHLLSSSRNSEKLPPKSTNGRNRYLTE
jgi:hypothetical protein